MDLSPPVSLARRAAGRRGDLARLCPVAHAHAVILANCVPRPAFAEATAPKSP
jgi:hypothetical protein